MLDSQTQYTCDTELHPFPNGRKERRFRCGAALVDLFRYGNVDCFKGGGREDSVSMDCAPILAGVSC